MGRMEREIGGRSLIITFGAFKDSTVHLCFKQAQPKFELDGLR